MPYIKLRDNREYTVSEDGTTLLTKHDPSGVDFWCNVCTIPSGKQVVNFRASSTGVNLEVLLDDNRWYKIDSIHSGLVLTAEEREKDLMAQKAEKEARKAEKEARKAKKEAESKASDENDDDENDDDENDDDDGSSSYSSSKSESEDDGICKKLIFTILPILPIWWVIKLPISIVTWPFRCIFSSKNKSLLPSYSFKKF